jgi:hypothetical protein
MTITPIELQRTGPTCAMFLRCSVGAYRYLTVFTAVLQRGERGRGIETCVENRAL